MANVPTQSVITEIYFRMNYQTHLIKCSDRLDTGHIWRRDNRRPIKPLKTMTKKPYPKYSSGPINRVEPLVLRRILSS